MPAAADRTVVTGAWGCGAFGCETCVKLLLQLLAASYAGVALRYCAYGIGSEADFRDKHGHLRDLCEYLRAGGCTAADLWDILLLLQAAAPRAPPDMSLFCTQIARTWEKRKS